MLSVHGRNEDRGFARKRNKGLGFWGERDMEENELEEGESCSYREENSSVYDPDIDVDLSYIDDKIQDVLGHFQKDFEGGLSLENLGAKFGGYGSFLPTQQRPPSILSQSRSPARLQNYTILNLLEQLSENFLHQTNASCPARSASSAAGTQVTVASLDISVREEHVTQNKHRVGDFSSKYKLDANIHASGDVQKSLKLRIKFPQENTFARSNTEIYSGLGLDISPPSSLDDNSDYGGDMSPDVLASTDESPMAMLQIMTAFPILSGSLLSPLSEVLLHLTEEERPLHGENTPESVRDSGAGTKILYAASLSGMDLKTHKRKTSKTAKPGKSGQTVHANQMAEEKGITVMLKKEIDIETPEGREIVLDALKLPLLISTTHDTCKNFGSSGDLDAGKGTNVPSNVSGEQREMMSQRKISSSDHVAPETRELRSKAGGTCSGDTFDNKMALPKGRFTFKANLAEQKDNLEVTKDAKGENRFSFDASNQLLPGEKNPNSDLDPSVQKIDEKTIAGKNGEMKAQERKDQFATKKKKYKSNKGSKGSTLKSSGTPKSASLLIKHKKKGMHARDDAESQHDVMMFQDSKKRADKNHQSNPTSHMEMVHVGNKVDLMDAYLQDKTDAHKIEQADKQLYCPATCSERLDDDRFENALSSVVNGVVAAPAIADGVISDAATVAPPTVVIDEYWVCCDKCQKWRLHPFGPDPACLPKKWLCSMQHWLPGLNKCSISEEESNKAFYASYQSQYLQNLHTQNCEEGSLMTLADAYHVSQSSGPTAPRSSVIFTSEKKKHSRNVMDNGSSFTNPTSCPSPAKKKESSIKSTSLNDVSQYPSDTTTSNKDGMRYMEKGYEHASRKQRCKQEKHKSLEGYLSGGEEYIEKGILSKSKSKRHPEEDIHHDRTFQKAKIDGLLSVDEEWNLRSKPMGKISSKVVPTDIIGKNDEKFTSHLPSSKGSKCDTGESDNSLRKKLKDQAGYSFNGESTLKVGSLYVEEPDQSKNPTKKRKSKEWQEIQELPWGLVNKGHKTIGRDQVQELRHDIEHEKAKKAKSSKPEGTESNTNSRDATTENKGSFVPPVHNNSCDFPSVRWNEKEHQLEELNGVTASKRMPGVNSLKDIGNSQHSTAATSSSSKVSGSCKSKTNLQEVKDSPVESVSSSPLRVSSVDKATPEKMCGKVDVTNPGVLNRGSPQKCQDGERNGRKSSSSTTNIMKNGEKTAQSVWDMKRDLKKSKHQIVLKMSTDARDGYFSDDDENNQTVDALDEFEHQNNWLSGLKQNSYELERKNYDAQDGSLQTKPGSGSSSRPIEKHCGTKSDFGKDKTKVSDFFSKHKDMHKDDTVLQNPKESRHKDGISGFRENLQPLPGEALWNQPLSDRTDSTDLASIRGRLQPCPSFLAKQELQQATVASHKGSKSAVLLADASKMPKQHKGLDNSKVTSNGSVKHPAVDDIVSKELDVRSPVRKENGYTALKEAKDMKNSAADRLKNGGHELESIGLYIHAALKFLHGASLLEPNDTEGAKQVDSLSIHVYIDTAKLCEFCAHAYEKHKDMAAAALAYKCMEVAYMRVMYLKHLYAHRVRHELLSSFPNVPGESPSSSASDVDNLNNPGISEKAYPVSGATSPQRASSLAISVHSRCNFDWLLNLANDVHLAMDATRRSQNALTVATGSSTEYGPEVLSSVKKVVDLSSHDVELLERLVCLAMGKIGR